MINNNMVVNFGYGDIEILGNSNKGIGKIGFNALEQPLPDKIGTTKIGNFEEKFYQCPVLLAFKTVHSIDGLIEVLTEVKSIMISQQAKYYI